MWFHGLAALGIPGASNVKVIDQDHLEGTGKVYVFREPDLGGDAFVEALRRIEDEEWVRHSARSAEFDREMLRYVALAAAFRKTKGLGDLPVKPVEPAPVRYIVSDATLESLAPILSANPRGLLLARDELSGWLSSCDCYRGGKGGDLSTWLEFHRAGRLTVDRKTGNRVQHIARAPVGVCGTIQPATLKRKVSPEFLESGLLARILFACPPAAIQAPPLDQPASVAEGLYAAAIRRLSSLRLVGDGAPGPVILDLARRGVRLTAADGRLQVDAPAGALTPDLRARIATGKTGLLEALADPRKAAFRAWESALEDIAGR